MSEQEPEANAHERETATQDGGEGVSRLRVAAYVLAVATFLGFAAGGFAQKAGLIDSLVPAFALAFFALAACVIAEAFLARRRDEPTPRWPVVGAKVGVVSIGFVVLLGALFTCAREGVFEPGYLLEANRLMRFTKDVRVTSEVAPNESPPSLRQRQLRCVITCEGPRPMCEVFEASLQCDDQQGFQYDIPAAVAEVDAKLVAPAGCMLPIIKSGTSTSHVDVKLYGAEEPTRSHQVGFDVETELQLVGLSSCHFAQRVAGRAVVEEVAKRMQRYITGSQEGPGTALNPTIRP